MSDTCICTLLTSDSYVDGALVLAHSIVQHGMTRDLAVLVTDDVSADSRAQLKVFYKHILPVNSITHTQERLTKSAVYRSELESTFTKLYLWAQVQFQRIVYIDADAFCIRNIDELFDLNVPFAAGPDHGHPDFFNSGVMVLQPDQHMFEKLRDMSQTNPSFDGGDQGTLNMVFSDYHRLSFSYNVQLYRFYRIWMPALYQRKPEPAIVHFLGKEKPWTLNPDADSVDESEYAKFYSSMLKRWWEHRTEVYKLLNKDE